MRCLTFLLLVMAMAMDVCAQSPENLLGNINVRRITLDIDGAVSSSLPFSRFIVIDNRFDTSKLGFMGKRVVNKITTRAPFASAVEAELNRVCATNLQKNDDKQLVVYIRHFWIQETNAPETLNNKIDEEDIERLVACRISFESFLRIDTGYFPVLRYDTAISKTRWKKNDVETVASESLLLFLEKIEKINWKSARKKMSAAEVSTFVSRFKTPAPISYNRPGIFLTFSDFRKGDLLDKKFEIRQDVTDELYIIENGEKKLLHEFWGFTDGDQVYINTGLNFYQLIKAGDAYEIWGRKTLLRHYPSGGKQPHQIASVGERMPRSRPWQLNMETGELY